MVSDGLLPDADLVNFFAIDELPEFIKNPSQEAIDHAIARRTSLKFQQNLSFPDISVGHPEPVDDEPITDSSAEFIQGRPASRGIAEGYARVAYNLNEASLLKPDEILIAPITDIGWTPYFSLISGLVTDLGSSVSHGAVIAREYGLPCIVNTRFGTRFFKTGDRVRIDGSSGTIVLIR
jgi:pyruvate,water dikinase